MKRPLFVGMRRFELPTTRPPDAYSNLAELHPGLLKSDAKVRLFNEPCKHSLHFLQFFTIPSPLRKRIISHAKIWQSHVFLLPLFANYLIIKTAKTAEQTITNKQNIK